MQARHRFPHDVNLLPDYREGNGPTATMTTRMALFFVFMVALPCFGSEADLRLLSVERIWNAAPFNGFTDLIRYKDRWYCVFREAPSHLSSEGKIRVLSSDDGEQWTSVGLISQRSIGLLDPKLTITPQGTLMLSGGSVKRLKSGAESYRSVTRFTENGTNWSEGQLVGDAENWLWSRAWKDGTVYSVGYEVAPHGPNAGLAYLYRSRDGILWNTSERIAFPNGNEAALVFEADGTAYALLRRDGVNSNQNAQLGTAEAPYTNWTWQDLGVRIGGPEIIQLPDDGRLLATTRMYDDGTHTSLSWIDPASGTLTEALRLPSGGDTSYAGMVLHEGKLWVSYYSSHEGKPSIYLAKVEIAPARMQKSESQ